MCNYVLLIDCRDEKGLVAKVSSLLYKQDFNIVSNDEFVDTESNRFFMRTEFIGNPDKEALCDLLRNELPLNAKLKITEKGRKKLVVLVTREPYCLGDLLVRCDFNDLNAGIQAVIGNYTTLEPLTTRFGVPFFHVPHQGLTRNEHEEKLLETINKFSPDYIVLAKYMRILNPSFVNRFYNKIINIHHSFLPAFIGAKPYRQAYNRGVKIIGATAHFVNDNLDEGPIIAQGVIPVNHSHSPADMARAGRDVEKNMLAKALRLVLEERVFVYGNRTIIFE